MSEEGPARDAPAVDQDKIAFHQPAGAWRFVVSEDSGRRHFFELLFQDAGKFDRGEGLADRHFAIRIGLVAFEDRVIDAKRTNIDRLGAVSADAAVGREVSRPEEGR